MPRRRPQRLSLRARLLWTFLVPLAVVLFCVGVISTAALRHELVDQVDTQLTAAVARSSSAAGHYDHDGDYGGATPDPAASLTAAHGEVWLSNQWVNPTDQTWNWEATP